MSFKIPRLTKVFLVKESRKVSWDQFRRAQPALARSWEQGVEGLDKDPNAFTWQMNDNGSVVAEPIPGKGEDDVEAGRGGTDIYNPVKKQWGNSDYVDDAWKRQALGGHTLQGHVGGGLKN